MRTGGGVGPADGFDGAGDRQLVIVRAKAHRHVVGLHITNDGDDISALVGADQHVIACGRIARQRDISANGARGQHVQMRCRRQRTRHAEHLTVGQSRRGGFVAQHEVNRQRAHVGCRARCRDLRAGGAHACADHQCVGAATSFDGQVPFGGDRGGGGQAVCALIGLDQNVTTRGDNTTQGHNICPAAGTHQEIPARRDGARSTGGQRQHTCVGRGIGLQRPERDGAVISRGKINEGVVAQIGIDRHATVAFDGNALTGHDECSGHRIDGRDREDPLGQRNQTQGFGAVRAIRAFFVKAQRGRGHAFGHDHGTPCIAVCKGLTLGKDNRIGECLAEVHRGIRQGQRCWTGNDRARLGRRGSRQGDISHGLRSHAIGIGIACLQKKGHAALADIIDIGGDALITHARHDRRQHNRHLRECGIEGDSRRCAGGRYTLGLDHAAIGQKMRAFGHGQPVDLEAGRQRSGSPRPILDPEGKARVRRAGHPQRIGRICGMTGQRNHRIDDGGVKGNADLVGHLGGGDNHLAHLTHGGFQRIGILVDADDHAVIAGWQFGDHHIARRINSPAQTDGIRGVAVIAHIDADIAADAGILCAKHTDGSKIAGGGQGVIAGPG